MCNFPSFTPSLPLPSIPGGLASLPTLPSAAPSLGFTLALAAFLLAFSPPSIPGGVPSLPSLPSEAPAIGINVLIPAFVPAFPVPTPPLPGALPQLPNFSPIPCPF